MRVRLKIQFDPEWKPQLRLNERYWIYLPDGEVFPIFTGHCGQWYCLYAQHMDYPSAEQAIAASIKHIIVMRNYDKKQSYRECRAKEQVFTFYERNHSNLTLPPKRGRAQPRTARAR